MPDQDAVQAIAADMAETIVAQQAELIALRSALKRAERVVDQYKLFDHYEEAFELLNELHQLKMEGECIGGGPGYKDRLAKVWVQVAIFEP